MRPIHTHTRTQTHTHTHTHTHYAHRWVLFGACQRKSKVQPAEFIYYKYTHHILAVSPQTHTPTLWSSSVCSLIHVWSWHICFWAGRMRVKCVYGWVCVCVCVCVCVHACYPDSQMKPTGQPIFLILLPDQLLSSTLSSSPPYLPCFLCDFFSLSSLHTSLLPSAHPFLSSPPSPCYLCFTFISLLTAESRKTSLCHSLPMPHLQGGNNWRL